MKSLRLTLLGLALVLSACSSGFSAMNSGSSSLSSTLPLSTSTTINPTILSTDTNVLPVTVGCGYQNEPCVSITICEPGTTTCKVVNNILVDTGSYGLRVFGSALSGMTFPGVSPPSGTGNLAECQSYLDGSSDWGPIASADVQLGGQTASAARLQIIQSTYPGRDTQNCLNPDDSPANEGFNGIIGVGMFAADCGDGCANTAANETYYACSGSACTNVAVPVAQQLQNPVTLLTSNNNGVALQLNAPLNGSAASVTGYLVLGIGTAANNSPVGAQVLTTDSSGNITTSFNGSSYTAFLDSGSNTLSFPQPSSITACTSGNADGFLCPSSFVSLQATQIGANGVAVTVGFGIDNAQTLLASSNMALAYIGTPYADGFDWGLPFFYGKTVYVGFDGQSSTLGSGTYWAY